MYSLTLKDFTTMSEGQFFDRKSARKEPKEIAHHLIGFANTGGGFLAIGIEDEDAESENPKTEENISLKDGLIKLLRNAKEILESRMENVENSKFWFEDTLIMMTYRDFSHPWEYPRIILYNNSKLLYSPYSKPSYITMDNVIFAHWPHNEKITNTLIHFGWGKELNQGIKNIYTYYKSQGSVSGSI